ncbi:rhomboid family intramembrane serine protease [Methylosinus sp. H3A]|uniref:rhomboid family intramembrane serine protease n=1 Tax=Methylosinus sp. H3A TaxID=2785786 RepID=UPI0018C255AB|nr:rhomboid family intramembrane serine protease [Methylosinus sp. H3A]MBG0808575.1 rhomboid family intramembrane serine protease [Methylosinus sp. H3A]
MNERSEARPGREKILNLPREVTGLLVALAAIQFALGALPGATVAEVFSALAFIPGRISFVLAPDAFMSSIAGQLEPGVEASDVAAAIGAERLPWWTFVTYALLHANWTHLAVNGVTLAAFGSPLARRFGAVRFLAFLALTAAAGAAAHLAIHPFDLGPVVGASAAISGTMAASARFAFAQDAEFAAPQASRRASSLAELWSNRRAIAFVGIWFAVNLIFGLFPGAAGSTEQIAWEAHVGGFAAGLLLFGAFDRRRDGGQEAAR